MNKEEETMEGRIIRRRIRGIIKQKMTKE